MTSAAEVALPGDPLARQLLEEELRLIREAEFAKEHPAFLLMNVECVDQKTGERFEFDLYTDADAEKLGIPAVERAEKSWFWQREVLDWALENNFTIILKGRQLGVTWIFAGEALWTMLSMPGAQVLVYSINEDEASVLVNRVWDMYESLPEHLKFGTKVLKPSRGRPHVEIELQHPDGRVSNITGMASTPKAGRGRTAALILLDEYAFHQWAQQNWKSVIPAVADGARARIISTANGVSNETTGGGNFYHHLWVNAGSVYKGLKKKFLRWDLHPKRDQKWRDSLVMKDDQKDEEYPNTPEEAFLLSGRPFFDRKSLKHYASQIREPIARGLFLEDEHRLPRTATFEPREDGDVFIYELPVGEELDEDGYALSPHSYALAADNATGRGQDFSTACVIDLSTGAPVAEIHTKLEPDLFAAQVHYLGRMYNDAIVAPEDQGGYGIPVITALRDGRNGRPAYPRIYRHRRHNRPDQVESTTYGFPMNTGTRPQVVNGLEKWVRDQTFPWVTQNFMNEAPTFVHRDTGTSPAASDGCNDDMVMAWGIAVELFRRYGNHPQRVRGRSRSQRRRTSRSSATAYPW